MYILVLDQDNMGMACVRQWIKKTARREDAKLLMYMHPFVSMHRNACYASHSFALVHTKPNQTQSTHELHRIDKLGVPRAVGPVHKQTARHNLSRAHIHPENVWVEGKVHDAVFMVKG